MKTSIIEWIDYDKNEKIKEGDYLVAYKNYHNPKQNCVTLCSYYRNEWVEEETQELIPYFNNTDAVCAYSEVPVYK